MSILRKVYLLPVVIGLCLAPIGLPIAVSADTVTSTAGTVVTGSQSYTQSLGVTFGHIALSGAFLSPGKTTPPPYNPPPCNPLSCAGAKCITGGTVFRNVRVSANANSGQATYTFSDPNGKSYKVVIDEAALGVNNGAEGQIPIQTPNHQITVRITYGSSYRDAAGNCPAPVYASPGWRGLVIGPQYIPPAPVPSGPTINNTETDLKGRIWNNGNAGYFAVNPSSDFYVWQPVCSALVGSNLPYVPYSGSETAVALSGDGTREYFLNFSMTASAVTHVTYDGQTTDVYSPGTPGRAPYDSFSGKYGSCPGGPGWSRVYKTTGTATVSVTTVVTFTFQYSYFDGFGKVTVVLPPPAPYVATYGGPQTHTVKQSMGISQG